MVKPFYTAIVAASVVFSTTLLVVAQQSPSLNSPVAGHTVAGSTATNPLAGNADAIQAGGRIFGQVCEKCHGPAGEGDPTAAPPLNTIAFIHGYEDAEVFQTIRKGVEDTEMEPHGRHCPACRTVVVDCLSAISSLVAITECPSVQRLCQRERYSPSTKGPDAGRDR